MIYICFLLRCFFVELLGSCHNLIKKEQQRRFESGFTLLLFDSLTVYHFLRKSQETAQFVYKFFVK